MRYYAILRSYYCSNFPYFAMDPHSHASWEIMYVQSGKCSILIDGKEYVVQEGEFIFLTADILHQLTIEKGSPARVINLGFLPFCLNDSVVPPQNSIDITHYFTDFQDYSDLVASSPLFAYDSQKMGMTLTELISELERKDGNNYVIQVMFHRVLIELSRSLHSRKASSDFPYVKEAMRYIQGHFDHKITIQEIAENVGISAGYLQALFKKENNTNLISYINHLRITKACYLLSQTQMDHTEVALSTGFSSRQHFGRTFKAVCGITPAEYRLKHRGDALGDTNMVTFDSPLPDEFTIHNSVE